MAGEKSKLFLLFREFTQPEWNRTVDELGDELTEFVYENKSATFDKETYLQWLDLVKSIELFSLVDFYYMGTFFREGGTGSFENEIS